MNYGKSQIIVCVIDNIVILDVSILTEKQRQNEQQISINWFSGYEKIIFGYFNFNLILNYCILKLLMWVKEFE